MVMTSEIAVKHAQACLFGGAIGDALGAPVEFMSAANIIGVFGDQGIRDYHPAYGRLGAIPVIDPAMLAGLKAVVFAWASQQIDNGYTNAHPLSEQQSLGQNRRKRYDNFILLLNEERLP